jgi:hypothetical protein
MTTHILLTGAGFSHNWGGYLATEAFEYLLTVTEGDDDLRSILWADKANGLAFEDSLAKLQNSFEKKYSPQAEQDLRNMISAVQRTCRKISRSHRPTLSFGPEPLTKDLRRSPKREK